MKHIIKYKWLALVVLIWGSVLCVPSFRGILHVWCEGSTWVQFSVLPDNFWDAQFDNNKTELPLVVDHLFQGFSPLQEKIELNELDQLIKENPNLPWLAALLPSLSRKAISIPARSESYGQVPSLS